MGGWVHRLAFLTAAAAFPLLIAGGVVTSRDAGMAFPDWPLSNGSVNPDGWLRDADKGSEHGHRILGALVGLFATATVVAAFRTKAPVRLRSLAIASWCAVSVQGLLGGLRVLRTSTDLALLHGCVGQAVFGLLVSQAFFTSREAGEPRPGTRDPVALRTASVFATLALFLQVVLGARLRHVQAPLYQHVLGAAIVTAAVALAIAVAVLRHAGQPGILRSASLLGGLLLLQLALGFLAADALKGLQWAEKASGSQVWLPTVHQTAGALLFAASLLLTLRAFRATAAPAPRGVFA